MPFVPTGRAPHTPTGLLFFSLQTTNPPRGSPAGLPADIRMTRGKKKARPRPSTKGPRGERAGVRLLFPIFPFFSPTKNQGQKRSCRREFFPVFLSFSSERGAQGARPGAAPREAGKKQKAPKREPHGRRAPEIEQKHGSSDGLKEGKTPVLCKRGPRQRQISFPSFFCFLSLAARPRRHGRAAAGAPAPARGRTHGAGATARPTRIRAP